MSFVQRGTAGTQVVTWLRAQIVDSQWPVGTRIPSELELIETLGVSRNTVREAVKQLTSTGMLEIRRGDGTFVRSRSDMSGVLERELRVAGLLTVHEVRRAIELEAVDLACGRRTRTDVSVLQELLGRRNRLGNEPDDLREFLQIDIAFHAAVVAAAHNSMLDKLFLSISPTIWEAYEFNIGAFEPRDSDASHSELVEAIEARDRSRAVRLARYYVDLTSDAILRKQEQLSKDSVIG